MQSHNIISLEEFRTQSLAKKDRENFASYLKVLSIDELQGEVDTLLGRLDFQDLDDSILIKAEVIMDELANRASNTFKHSIKVLKDSLIEHISEQNYQDAQSHCNDL